MDLPGQRTPPPVTIEGGPGWTVDAEPAEVGAEPPPGRRPGLRTAVAAAALLGLVAGAGLQDWRTEQLGEGDAGALSVAVSGPREGFYGSLLGEASDGRPAARLTVELANTGPRTVELRDVELVGTGFAAEDAAGQRLAPGARTRVDLVRPIDCAALPAASGTAAVPPARVVALTGAGLRSLRVTSGLDPYVVSGEVERSACGAVPASGALHVEQRSQRLQDAAVRLGLELHNVSAAPLVVVGARTAPGLGVVLLGDDGTPLAFPLTLPAGDFSVPRDPYRTLGEGRRVVVEVTVPDCAAVPPASLQVLDGTPLVEVDLRGDLDSGTAFLGNPALLGQLRRAACGPG